MAATERRTGLSRRGMTVLGKLPVAPKPINLPSQRLENQGLIPDVDIVPRGSCSWGHAGRFPGTSGNGSRKLGSAPVNPVSSGKERENVGGKVESKPVTSSGSKNSGVKDGGVLLENSIQSSSANSRTIPSSAGATITAQAFDSIRKMEEPRNSGSRNCNPTDSQKYETADPPLQRSGDGYIRGVSVPPGFGQCGPHGNHSRAGVPPSESQHNGAVPGMCSDPSQQNGSHNFPGMPYHSGTKDREIIVIHMVGNPGFYGNYPPHLGYPENYSRNGMYGNFPLQFGNFEPYFGLQGHGRLHGGAQLSSAASSDLFDDHEEFICYEKECYKGACHDLGRQKNGWVRGSLRENTFLGGAQSDIHEALISGSTSALKSRSISQKHLSRNAGRLKSMYRNGRMVSIEASSAVTVPEKRITLLTKVSQREMLTNGSLEGPGVYEVARAQGSVGSVISAEGKAPTDASEEGKVTEDSQVNKSAAAGASVSLEISDEINLHKETEMKRNKVLVLTTTCNDKCLHCKAEAAGLEGSTARVCQACKKTALCESALSTSQCCLRPTEEVPVASTENSNSIDGCNVEVKHVIFDADSYSTNILKGPEDSSLSSSVESPAADKKIETLSSTEAKSSSLQNNQAGKERQRLSGKKNINNNWKPKRPVGAATVDFKMFAPKVRKAVTKKAAAKNSANDCISEAILPANCNTMVSLSNKGADSMTSLSQTETCKMQCSSLPSSGAVSVDKSHGASNKDPDGAVSADCIASNRQFQKKKGKNIRKTNLHKDYHDNVAAVLPVETQESSMNVCEDISSTEGQKQEPKGAGSTNEKAWRPKMPTALQSKSATKASGIQVSKAHVPRNPGLQGRKVVGSSLSADPEDHSEEAKEDAVHKNNSLSTSQSCVSQVLTTNISWSSEVPSKNNAGRQQNLLFRKRSAEQAALGHSPSRNSSNNNQHMRSLIASPKGKLETEHSKQVRVSVSSCENDSMEMDFSVSASKYHMIRRRVYHVADGSGKDYYLPSAPLSGKLHQIGNQGSNQISSMQQQKRSQAKELSLSSGSSLCTESLHSEESLLLPDSMCGVEVKSCRSWSEGIPHLEQAGGVVSQHPSRSLVSSSGSEDSESRKHVKPRKRPSVWKPKVATETAVLENGVSKDGNEGGTSTSTLGEGASNETTGSLSSSQDAASGNLHAEENNEKHAAQDLPLETESVSFELLEGDSLKEVLDKDSQELSEIVVSKEEMQHGSSLGLLDSIKSCEHAELIVQGHAEEVPSLGLLDSVKSCEREELIQKQIKRTWSQEPIAGSSQGSTTGNRKPFFKKSNPMNYEKANRYHQLFFKKYKQVGQWKPKADLHNQVLESVK